MMLKIEDVSEHFIIFQKGDLIDHICKYEPLKPVEEIKKVLEKEETSIPDNIIPKLIKDGYIRILMQPSSKFIIIKNK